MKFLTFIVIVWLVLFTIGCKDNKEGLIMYNVKWNVEVTYTNGEVDTLRCEIKTHKDYLDICKMYLDSDFGCLRSYNVGINVETFACGDRKFKILSIEKARL